MFNVSHQAVAKWCGGGGGKPVAVPIADAEHGPEHDIATTPATRRKVLDRLISVWSGRAETDRFAAGLTERLLRERERLDTADNAPTCSGHLEADVVLSALKGLERYTLREIRQNLRRQLHVLDDQLTASEREFIDVQVSDCVGRVEQLFRHWTWNIPGASGFLPDLSGSPNLPDALPGTTLGTTETTDKPV